MRTGLLFLAALCWLPAAAAGQQPWSEVHGSVAELRQASRFEEAADLLERWIEGHPQDGAARLLLGQVLADGGRASEAVRVWSRLLEELPPEPERYRLVSARMEDQGFHEEALDALVQGAGRLDGADPFAWERAELAIGLGRFEEAVAAHLEVLRQHPWRVPLVENRIAHMGRDETGYLGAAEAALSRAEGAGRTRAALLAAAASLETGRPGRGVQALRLALPGDEVLQALYSFASRCEARGHAGAAAEAYALFAAEAGDSPHRYRSLLKQAEMREVLGDGEGAVELYTRLAAGHPRRSEAAEALLRTARLQAAGPRHRGRGDGDSVGPGGARRHPRDAAAVAAAAGRVPRPAGRPALGAAGAGAPGRPRRRGRRSRSGTSASSPSTRPTSRGPRPSSTRW